jgi:hypothetical protein
MDRLASQGRSVRDEGPTQRIQPSLSMHPRAARGPLEQAMERSVTEELK